MKAKIAIAGLSLLLSLLVVEVLLRTFSILILPVGIPNLSGKCSFPDNKNGSFFFSYNSHGFRTNEFEEIESNLNIFIVGDSQCYGSGVDQGKTVTELLEKKLQEINPKFKCYNLSSPGSSVSRYFKLIEFALKLNPSHIVILPYSGNDLVEFETRKTFNNNDSFKSTGFALNQLHIYHLFAQSKGLLKSSNSYTNEFLKGEECVGQSILQIDFFEREKCFPEAIDDMEKSMEGFSHSLSKEYGIKIKNMFSWFVIPTKFHAIDMNYSENNYLSKVLRKYHLSFVKAKLKDINFHDSYKNIYREYFKNSEIDPSTMIEETLTKDHYWSHDWHLNNTGHEWLADMLFADLSKKLSIL